MSICRPCPGAASPNERNAMESYLRRYCIDGDEDAMTIHRNAQDFVDDKWGAWDDDHPELRNPWNMKWLMITCMQHVRLRPLHLKRQVRVYPKFKPNTQQRIGVQLGIQNKNYPRKKYSPANDRDFLMNTYYAHISPNIDKSLHPDYFWVRIHEHDATRVERVYL